MADIFVINLEQSRDRREKIAAQLDSLGLAFEFFNAIDGRKGHELFDKYCDRKANSYLARPLTAGQLGCYASHYLLWLTCIERGKPLIVLEDDAEVNVNLLRFSQTCEQLNDQACCIRLFETQTTKHKKKRCGEVGEFELYEFHTSHMGTIGYYLNPRAADKYIRHSEKWFLPVDIFMDKYWLHDVKCHSLLPACLSHSIDFESDIGYQPIAKRHIGQNLRRESYRAIERIRKNFYLLRNKTRAQ